jgi:hypothetical protein
MPQLRDTGHVQDRPGSVLPSAPRTPVVALCSVLAFGCAAMLGARAASLRSAERASESPTKSIAATEASHPERSAWIPRPTRALPEKTARFAEHWAYQAMAHPAPPPVAARAWVRNEVDAFVLARLEQESLTPAPEADRRTLLRRASLALVGIPPTADEVDAFERDATPDAYERRIDALLASPLYGERWGRHWLDVARYADSNGVDENIAYANAFRYRDYVIDAFNRDLPFDAFVVEQLAGDLLPEPQHPTRDDDARTRSRLAALGLLALGPKMLAEPDKEKERVDVIDEQIDVVTKAFLAQTVSCARCHDHKFDPISHADYFALSGVFRSVTTFDNIATVGRVAQRPMATAAEVERAKAWRELARELDSARNAAHDALRARDRAAMRERFVASLGDPRPGRWPRLLSDAAAALRSESAERIQWNAARSARDAHERAKPAELPLALVVKETKVDETPIHDRGDHTQPTGEPIPRAVPAVLERVIAGPTFPADASGRLELARWIVDPENPLTARVIVNRLWTWHFGNGIVDTPSNFGVLGSNPSHPELLDFLARRFVRDGWSLKKFHRMVMTSATYRQASTANTPLPEIDSGNRLLSRFPRRRVEAEAIRDSVLAVSGALDPTMGGSLLGVADHDYVTNDQSANSARYDTNRRTVYLPVIRNAMFGVFSAFDYPDSSMPIDCRSNTVVAPQALFFMNAPFVDRAAERLATELSRSLPDLDARVREAFRRALARTPDARERERSRDFLADLERSGLGSDAALARLCHALLSTNEFVTME